MSTGNHPRTRSKRVASVALPPGLLLRTITQLRRSTVLMRLGLCVLAAVLMWLATKGWTPPLGYRTWDIPNRDIVARVDFEREDPEATKAAKERAKERADSQFINIYINDAKPLEQLRHALKDRVFQVIRAQSRGDLDSSIWREFLPDPTGGDGSGIDDGTAEAAFSVFRDAFTEDADLTEFEKSIERVFVNFERHGLLEKLEHESKGSSIEIFVQPVGTEKLVFKTVDTESFVSPVGGDKSLPRVRVEDVRIAEISGRLREDLTALLKSDIVAEHVYYWIEPKLPTTLTWNEMASDKAASVAATAAAEAVRPVMEKFSRGERLPSIAAATPLSVESVELLQLEQKKFVEQLSHMTGFLRTLAHFGMYVAIYVLCGFYVSHREPELLRDLRQFATILLMFVIVVALGQLSVLTEWRAEIIPLLVFGIIMAIAYRQDLALVLTAAVALVLVLTTGRGLTEFVIYVATAAAAIQSCAHIRSRTKLIYVGMYAGVVALLTALGASVVSGYPLSTALAANAALYSFFAFLAGVLMTGLLPFIETLFDVQTEISLLEMGDAAHPLLQELVRRAPGTYNHSINVASIAEAAADAIGANGLLVRVGAYFHDIGKMLKPGYFAENQSQGDNRHESLVPAMSTLIIIAHVKDGADLARQYHLPQSIVNFILQHHGTTLVQYFYDQAKGQSQDDPNREEVEESSFRYPGPKPQSKEAGVLMLADSVEGASRSLVDPTPSRIESIVEEIAMERLLDGQFDECGLTLSELRAVEVSLAKSLTAVFHGRVKYPSQQTA